MPLAVLVVVVSSSGLVADIVSVVIIVYLLEMAKVVLISCFWIVVVVSCTALALKLEDVVRFRVVVDAVVEVVVVVGAQVVVQKSPHDAKIKSTVNRVT